MQMELFCLGYCIDMNLAIVNHVIEKRTRKKISRKT